MSGKSRLRPLLSFVLILALSAAVALGLRHVPAHWWRADVAAEVHGQAVTVADVQDGLRAHLWRRGQQWETLDPAAQNDAREAVMHDLIRKRLIRRLRKAATPDTAPDGAAAAEMQGWLKQFQADGERTLRMGWQEATDAEMLRRITEAQADQAWLEAAVQNAGPPRTEAELRQWYDTHAEQLRVPVLHRASHIYLTAHDRKKADREQEIRAIHQKLLADGTAFAELARQYSEDDRTKNRGGDLGWFSADRMPQDFMKAVEAMNVRQTSAPLRTKLGWHILRIDDRKPSRLPAFEEVQHEIAAAISSQHRQRDVEAFVEKLLADNSDHIWRCAPERLRDVGPARLRSD